MYELVVRPRRLPGLLITTLFVYFFALNYYAFFVTAPSLEPGSFVFALVFQLLWASGFTAGVARIFTPALYLSQEGFSLGGDRMVAWSDVEEFEPPTGLGMQVARSTRIRYVPEFERSWLEIALGSFGFGPAPTRLSGLFYDTGGEPLDEILRRFWVRTA